MTAAAKVVALSAMEEYATRNGAARLYRDSACTIQVDLDDSHFPVSYFESLSLETLVGLTTLQFFSPDIRDEK
ncbi:hypothetical protein QLQ12_24530 [Actinoplanes sp. NEAU-A12]|uniref:Uncharacterized protein n=1 Tax=Actinoplanes sandaracinus TaxID=3045177 RepID=A0ABT6WPW6_9ACTN|nr:hypothetical protein [Actinoplanes sandaracinus]MDI6101793.1 hypothetical protein [Actinoplanes sandaracinus]